MSPQQQQAITQASGSAGTGLAVESNLLASDQVPASRSDLVNKLGEVPQGELELLRHLGCGALLLREHRTRAVQSE